MAEPKVEILSLPPGTDRTGLQAIVREHGETHVVVFSICERVTPEVFATFSGYMFPLRVFLVDVDKFPVGCSFSVHFLQDIVNWVDLPCIPLFRVYHRERGVDWLADPIMGTDLKDLKLAISKAFIRLENADKGPRPSDDMMDEEEDEEGVSDDADDDLAAAIAASLAKPPAGQQAEPSPPTGEDLELQKALALSLAPDADGDAPDPAAPESVMDTTEDSPPGPAEASAAAAAPAGAESDGPPKLSGDAAVDHMLKENMITRGLFTTLTEEMGVSRVRAAIGLYGSQNASIDHAMTFLEENPLEETLEIMVETEEQKARRIAQESERLKQIAQQRRRQRVRDDANAARQREKARREGGKVMQDAKERYEAEQRKRERMLRRQEEKNARLARVEAKRKIMIDKVQRQLEGARRRKDTARIATLEDKLEKLQGRRPSRMPSGDRAPQDPATAAAAASTPSPPAPAGAGAAAAAPSPDAAPPAPETPKCRIRVRLFDGSSHQHVFEQSATVFDLFQWVASLGVTKRFRLRIPPGGPTLSNSDRNKTLGSILGRGGSVTCVN